jgi:predicted RNA-binding protein (virulence factor B family)
MLEAGQLASLTVSRKKEYGYFLTDGQTDIFLHKNEATSPLEVGSTVNVFLYVDHQDRLAATMAEPKIKEDQFGWLAVSDVNRKLGVFLDLGINKELLLSKDDLLQEWSRWPQKGDQVFVGLKHDKKGRLLAKLGLDVELSEQEEQGSKELINTEVTGHVYRIIAVGAFIFTTDRHIAFLHRDEMKSPVRLGQAVTARVKNLRDEDGRLNVTTLVKKEIAYGEDAEQILNVLRDRGGAIPYSDDSSPENIRQAFKISKSAFKRAIGKLMKEGQIYQEDGWTYLKDLQGK